MRSKIAQYRIRVLEELHKSFHEDRSAHEIARSFAIGVFITALPTLGLGLILFAVLIKLFDSISKLALIASVVVLNPIVKPIVYLASINLGGLIVTRRLTVTTDPEMVITFLVVGNIILAIIFSVAAYVFALAAVERYRGEGLHAVNEIEEVLNEEKEKLEKTMTG